jgi:hypothetical protein
MEVQKNAKQCEMCKVKEAITLCLDCYSYFCEVCYKCVHNFKQNSNHRKEKIDLFVPIDTTCSYHERSPMNLFCIDEKGNIKKY